MRAQTREESVNSRSLYQEQAGQLSPRGAEGLSDPLMMVRKEIRKKSPEGGSPYGSDGNNNGVSGKMGRVQSKVVILDLWSNVAPHRVPETQVITAVKQHFFCKIEKRGMEKFEVIV